MAWLSILKGLLTIVSSSAPKIAAVNPTTMAIREWTLPHADSRPRRIAITSDDVIYYADYSRGYLGRLDPKTGAIKEWASPGGPKSQLLWDWHVLERDDLVQRIGGETRIRWCASIPEDRRSFRDLGDSGRRRRGAEHDDHARREHRDGGERAEHCCVSYDRQVMIFRVLLALGAAVVAQAAQCSGPPSTGGASWNGWADAANTRFQNAKASRGWVLKTRRNSNSNGRLDFLALWPRRGLQRFFGGRVFVGDANGVVYALDAHTGCTYWTFTAAGGVQEFARSRQRGLLWRSQR